MTAIVIFMTTSVTFFLKALTIEFIMGMYGFKNKLIINASPQKDVILFIVVLWKWYERKRSQWFTVEEE